MATAGHTDGEHATAETVAARLREADFVRLVGAATGDGVAATALLARALSAVGVPTQASVASIPTTAERETEADCTVALGRPAGAADLTVGTGTASATAEALDAVRDLGDGATLDADAVVLGFAGTIAAGETPGEKLHAAARECGLDRRPGLGLPTDDVVDGLAHTTLVHAPVSGAPESVRNLLADLDLPDTGAQDGDSLAQSALDEDDRRRLASAVALAVAGDEDAAPGRTGRVEALLRPTDGGPCETLAGYADVLDALARERPGAALALARGADVDALSVWRDHARRAHEAVRTADLARYDGLTVARCASDAPVGTVARLLAETRSPEPVTLVVGDGVAAAVATAAADTHVGAALEAAAAAVGGEGGGTRTRGRATVDGDGNHEGDSTDEADTDAFVETVRAEL